MGENTLYPVAEEGAEAQLGPVLWLLTRGASRASWLRGAGPEGPQASGRCEGFVETFWVLSILKQAEKNGRKSSPLVPDICQVSP